MLGSTPRTSEQLGVSGRSCRARECEKQQAAAWHLPVGLPAVDVGPIPVVLVLADDLNFRLEASMSRGELVAEAGVRIRLQLEDCQQDRDHPCDAGYARSIRLLEVRRAAVAAVVELRQARSLRSEPYLQHLQQIQMHHQLTGGLVTPHSRHIALARRSETWRLLELHVLLTNGSQSIEHLHAASTSKPSPPKAVETVAIVVRSWAGH
jgi:hypothetical protein